MPQNVSARLRAELLGSKIQSTFVKTAAGELRESKAVSPQMTSLFSPCCFSFGSLPFGFLKSMKVFGSVSASYHAGIQPYCRIGINHAVFSICLVKQTRGGAGYVKFAYKHCSDVKSANCLQDGLK